MIGPSSEEGSVEICKKDGMKYRFKEKLVMAEMTIIYLWATAFLNIGIPSFNPASRPTLMMSRIRCSISSGVNSFWI
jgi:hypothetical protein